MTSINFHFRASVKEGRHEGKLYIRLIHRRKVKTLVTGYEIFPEEWDRVLHDLILPADDLERSSYLTGIQEKMRSDISRLQQSVITLSRKGAYTLEEVCKGFFLAPSGNSLQGYCNKVSVQLEESGQARTARAYRSATKSLIRYNSGKELRLEDIQSGLICGYEKHLLDRGLQLNTVSFYMRNLRALYYRAVHDRLIKRQEENPFGKVFTGIHETRRRALNDTELNKLARLDQVLSVKSNRKRAGHKEREEYKHLQRSLQYFMFCFHARGMSFIDMSYLRKSEISGGMIRYKRKKTGGYLEVKITKPMRKILDIFSHETTGSPYVFPVIDPSCGHERIQHETGMRQQNQRLKTLAQMAGIEKTLSTHVARHTWATLAKWSKEEISVISEALGHRDIKTTYKYLASFERSTMDRLSEKISGIIKAA